MLHDKVEEILRRLEKKVGDRAQKARLGAEKLRAGKQRVNDARVMQELDQALGNAIESRGGFATSSSADPGRSWKIQQWAVQKDMKARGLMTVDEDGAKYESGQVDRHNRPAEKVATGEVKFDRWARIKDARNEAMATNYYSGDYYHGDVLRDRYERDRLEGYETMTEEKQEQAIKAHSAWREKEIQSGSEAGYLARDDKGNVFAIERRPQKIGPAEKLITGKTKGMRFKEEGGCGIG